MRKRVTVFLSDSEVSQILSVAGRCSLSRYLRDAGVKVAKETAARRTAAQVRTEFRGSSTVDFSENQDRHREVIAGVEHVEGIQVKRGNGSSLPPGVVKGSDLL